jgi:surface antigen
MGRMKRAIINVDDGPRPGDVAVIAVSDGPDAEYGHLAMVRDVTEVSIQIEEANFVSGWITVRTAIGDDLEGSSTDVGYRWLLSVGIT